MKTLKKQISLAFFLVPVIMMIFTLATCDDNFSLQMATEKTIQSIELNNVKQEFNLGEEFSTGDYRITVNYNDGSSQIFNAAELPEISVDSSAYDKDTAGTYPIYVTYLGVTGTYSVKVIDPDDTPDTPVDDPNQKKSVPQITVSSAGLNSLKVGQQVNNASIVYTLADGTYALSIVPADFIVKGLPTGLSAANAMRLSSAQVSVTVTGAPAAYSETLPVVEIPSIPAANVSGAENSIIPAGTVAVSAVARGDGMAVSGAPTVNGTPAQNSITVNTVSILGSNPDKQTVQYAITISSSDTAPTSGWQSGTTFNSLTSGTSYYVWARSAQSANYDAGLAQRSNIITTAGATIPSIEISSTGLTNLKVGQAVSGANVTFTLANGTYVSSITPSVFTVSNLPPGLNAAAAVRTSSTAVTVTISGTPSTYSASTRNLTLPTAISSSQVTGATANITPVGAVTASAVAKGDGAVVSVPAVSGTPTLNSITVGAVTLTPATGQSVEYAITASPSGSAPASGWGSSTTFGSLNAGTSYYVWARTIANTNYNAGPATSSAAINTAAALAINMQSTGLTGLKVGVPVSANITFNLTNGTYANPISPSSFAVSNLPPGLNPAAAVRTSNTVVTVTISGSPTTVSTSTRTVTLPVSIPSSQITVQTSAIVPTGSIVASAVTMGDGADVSKPAVSGTPTANSITVGAVTLTPATTGQSAQYLITTSNLTTMPTSGTWQSGTTFSSLNAAAAYYVWARSASTSNYSAGTAIRSDSISTAAALSITVTSTGLNNLNVGQAVSNAAILYTLSGGTYVNSINAANFAVTGLPTGLTAAAASRTSSTVVTINVTGTPAAYSAAAPVITLPASIPAANVTGAAAAVTCTGSVTISATAKGGGAAVSIPAVSGTPTQNSITAGAVTLTPATTGQTAEYAITTNSSTTLPASGITWQTGAVFNNLNPGTAYYVWARSASNTNYDAGTPLRSAAINTAAAAGPVIIVTSTGLDNLKVGQTVSGAYIRYTLSNGTYASSITPANFAVSNLPGGLTAGTASRTSGTVVTITITGTPSAFNASTRDVTVPATIAASNVTGASGTIIVSGTVTASAVAKGGGATVSTPAVSGTPTQNSITVRAVTLTPTTTGQSAEYAITTDSSTTLPASGITWQTGVTFNSLAAGTAYYVWARSAENTNYSAGTALRSNSITTAAAATAPSMTTSSLPNGTVGVSYNQTLAASGTTPITWTVQSGSLPGNLSLNTTSGAITGTPNAAGSFTFTMRAANSAGYNDKSFTVTIAKGTGAVVSAAPTVNGTPTQNSITVNAVTIPGSNPGGQTVQYAKNTTTTAPTDGWQAETTFTGLNANTQYYIFARSAENTNYNAGAAQRSAAITTAAAATAPSITTTSILSNGTVGVSYSQTLAASGTTPITWSVQSGNLPGNLSLNATSGAITGMPNAAGPFTFTIRAANSAGNNDKQFTVTIAKGAGAGVSGAPTVSGTPTSSSITIIAVSISGSNPGGQTVQYAINQSNTTVPTSGWQNEITFGSLTANTVYRVWARSTENNNYNAGTAQVSAAITTAAAGSISFSGAGTSASPYLINNLTDLNTMRDFVNAETAPYANAGVYYRLTNNISITGNWVPIGNEFVVFRGNFNGDGKTITVTINQSSTNYIGLFGRVDGSTIKNLGIVAQVTGNSYTGGLAGYVGGNSNITNCYISGNISGSYGTGAVTGYLSYGTITNCYSSATVTGSVYIGGLAGVNNDTISNSYTIGKVTGGIDTGGIAGYNLGTIISCIALNSDILNADNYFGRITGYNSNTLSNNAAFSGMLVNGSIVTGGTVSNINGADINATQAKTQSTYSGSPRNWAFGTNETSPWSWGVSGYSLPTLWWQTSAPSMPGYLNIPIISVTSTGLNDLKVGQAVNGATIVYTLSNGTYASSITASYFTNITGLPPGLTVGNAVRTNGTVVTVTITGTPTTQSSSAVNVTLPASIPASQVTGASSAVTVTGFVSASAVARADGTQFNGAGTSASPYLINNASELAAMRDFVNAETAPYANAGVYYRLTNNISITGNWVPIGNELVVFRGNFNGDGKTITVTINQSSTNHIGLFGRVDGSTIKNLGIVAQVTGNSFTGGLAGSVEGNSNITNCYISGNISGSVETGAVTGYLSYGTITNCYSSATVTGSVYIGGLAGVNNDTISNSYTIGKVTGSSETGGIAGYNLGTIISCIALNSDILNADNYFGRITGLNGTLSNNAAFSGMLVNGSIVTGGTVSNINGADINATQAKTQSTYSGSPRSWAFGTNETSPWSWSVLSGYSLPTLYWQTSAPAMPDHLK